MTQLSFVARKFSHEGVKSELLVASMNNVQGAVNTKYWVLSHRHIYAGVNLRILCIVPTAQKYYCQSTTNIWSLTGTGFNQELVI